MAREIARSFDHALGAVVVRIEQFPGGPVEVHTLYPAAADFCSRCGGARRVAASGARELDIEAEIRARIGDAAARRAAVEAAFRKAGWQG